MKHEAVAPGDICLLYNGRSVARNIDTLLRNRLQDHGIRLELQTGKDVQPDPYAVLATTPHSFKGYDSEIIVVANADQFVGSGKILANVLYTAMTRARSLLAIFSCGATTQEEGKRISVVLRECLDMLVDVPDMDTSVSRIDEIADLVEILGTSHRTWLEDLWRSYHIEQEPLIAANGHILAQPIFWLQANGQIYACFGEKPPGASTRFELEDKGISVLMPGHPIS